MESAGSGAFDGGGGGAPAGVPARLPAVNDPASPSPVPGSRVSAGGPVAPEAVLPWVRSAVEAGRVLILTVRSLRSGSHLTYRLRPFKRGPSDRGAGHLEMVDVLTGPANTADYTFIGAIYFSPRGSITVLTGARTENPNGGHGSSISDDAPSAKTLRGLFERLARGQGPAPAAEVWHDGTCARCGRPLTTPESLERGIGPICAQKGGSEDGEG